MGVTGANGFPCCSKDSVDVIDTQIGINQHQLQLAQKDNETELENSLVEQAPPRKVDLNLDTELELEVDPEDRTVPPLEWCPTPTLQPEAKLDSNLEACNEQLEEQRYRIESIQPYTEELMQQNTCQLSMRSDSIYLSPTEEEQVSPAHRSIRVQTSKHLFWSDKLIQASERSLQWEMSRLRGQKSTDKTTSHLTQESIPEGTLCSEKQLQNPSTQPELSDAGSRQPPGTQLPSNFPPAISLENLVNFATSLAIASSSMGDLPNLEHMMQGPREKATDPSPVSPVVERAVLPAKEEPGQGALSEWLEKPPEKLLEAGEPEKALEQKDKNILHPYLDFSKPEFQRAVFEGKVKFLPTSAMASPPKVDRKDLVPGSKEGSPLLLKIHFKLPSPEK